MVEPVTIKIGDRSVDISAIPLGGIRRIMGALHRAEQSMMSGRLDESLLDDIVTVLSAATGIPIEEMEKLETNLAELDEGLRKAIKVSGLEEMAARARGAVPGEARPGEFPASTPSMNSTPASAPVADGLGNTSTST